MTRTVRLAFVPDFVESILNGTKRVTARYDFERPLDAGDTIRMCTPAEDWFACARCEFASQMTAFDLWAADLDGYPSFGSCEALLSCLGVHYPDADLTPKSDLTVIGWEDAVTPADWRWEVMAR